jgi:hypothetical protein
MIPLAAFDETFAAAGWMDFIGFPKDRVTSSIEVMAADAAIICVSAMKIRALTHIDTSTLDVHRHEQQSWRPVHTK